jgi:phosphonopyruvate decarboxylase
MLQPDEFVSALKGAGFSFFSGVPCSYLKSMINCVIEQSTYIIASNEGDAVSLCAGAYMAGRNPVVLMQNSGLSNAISPLTSLNQVFGIPVLGFISLRGEENTSDEPQHELMGKITIPFLDLMKIQWDFLSRDQGEAEVQLKMAIRHIREGRSFFFVVRKNTFSKHPPLRHPEKYLNNSCFPAKVPPEKISPGNEGFPLRIDVLRTIHSLIDQETALIAPTGYTSRELYEIGDVENIFYMTGSMGCAGPIGMGIAIVQPRKNIIVIDGDGSLLMRLSGMTMIGYYKPGNMVHIVLDNNSYESTGGQRTVSDGVDFIEIAHACGYEHAEQVRDMPELKDKLNEWKKKRQLTFLYLKIRAGTRETLGRPSIHPHMVRQRFMEFLHDGLA